MLAGAMLSLLIGLALARVLAGENHAPVASPRSAGASHPGASSLPPAARAPVSGALGAADHAYAIRVAGGDLGALNPAQSLQIRFGRAQVQLASHRARLAIGLRGVGYGDASRSLGAAVPRASGNRVTYEHAGVTEWYANGPLGLEQGFTITRAPAGDSARPLTLSMAVSGRDGHAALASDGHSVLLGRPGQATLRYGDLNASDARGRTLRSWLAVEGGQILLRVDARGARYPLRIDPLVQEGDKLTASEEVGAGFFGFSVAMSADGDTALIGAPSDNHSAGAVWVFVRSGAEWVQQGPKLVSSEGSAEEECIEGGEESDECNFGRSVAVSADGNTALIGAPHKKGPCSSGECQLQGAALVYTRSGSSWTLQSTLVGGSEEGPDGRFGRSVALSADGSTAVLGAPADEAGNGSLWVFARSSSSWAQQGAKLTGQAEFGPARLGRSVAISADGTAALAGGPADNGFAGAAWLFTRSGATWSQQKLVGAGEEVGEGRFGSSVTLSADGSTALVGGRTDNGSIGAVWPFARSGEAMFHQGPKLTGGEEEIGGGEFGFSIALSADGNVALIGAPRDSGMVGAAWLLTRSGATWANDGSKLTGVGTSEKSPRKGLFGTSVAMRSDGATALIGAPLDAGKTGAVWRFADPALLPSVSGLSPKAGPPAGGTTVQISGTRLTGATAVNFDSTPATSFTVNSDGSITATSPPRPGGGTSDTIVHVTVSTPVGISPISPANQFRYAQPPLVSSLSPTEGPTGGATSVTITGNHLSEASAVSFGGANASSFTVNSPTSITAISPAASAATVHVTVTTPGGTSNETARDLFAFLPPSALAGSTGGGSGGGASGGGVLGFGPVCNASLVSRSIVVRSNGRAAVKLTWRGTGTCKGKLRLRVKVKAGKRLKVKTIGTGTFVVTGGKVRTISVKLNALGRSLLKAAHGRLRASLLIANIPPGAVPARTANVRLTVPSTTRKVKTPGK